LCCVLSNIDFNIDFNVDFEGDQTNLSKIVFLANIFKKGLRILIGAPIYPFKDWYTSNMKFVSPLYIGAFNPLLSVNDVTTLPLFDVPKPYISCI